MDPIIISIPGDAVGKGRARHRHVKTKDGREFDMAYTPAKTRQYEGIVRSRAEDAMAGRPPLQGPLHVAVVIRVRPPMSWPTWKREAALRGDIVPDSKPDSDNIKKAIYDGINGVVWVDDNQAAVGAWRKEYHDKPGVFVKVVPLRAASSRITRKDQLPGPVQAAPTLAAA
jgi:Holliday junction resolvase RusA-like endonuclease